MVSLKRGLRHLFVASTVINPIQTRLFGSSGTGGWRESARSLQNLLHNLVYSDETFTGGWYAYFKYTKNTCKQEPLANIYQNIDLTWNIDEL
jgi:hypothetical protein